MATYLPEVLNGGEAQALLLHVDSEARIAGPGDALRFVHAVHILQGYGCVGTIRCLVMSSELSRLADLNSGASTQVDAQTILDGGVTWASEPDVELALPSAAPGALLGNSGLNPFLMRLKDDLGPVLHVHLGRGLSNKTDVGKIVRGRGCRSRVQIDANPLLLNRRLALELPQLQRTTRCAAPLTVGVFVRRAPSSGKVDVPAYFVRRVAKLTGIRRVWFGLPNDADYASIKHIPTTDTLLPYGTNSYLKQVHNLRQLDAAVGYNSGGLDLASAAGIPVLRFGEYQRIGRSGAKPWGAAYNSFLAIATNIGVEPTRPRADALERTLDAWLELLALGELRAPRHLILGANVPLSVAAFRAGGQKFEYSNLP